MKRRIVIALAGAALLGLSSWQLHAATRGDGIRNSVIAGGGGHSSSGDVDLRGTIAQPYSGPPTTLTPSGQQVHGGFWPGVRGDAVVGVDDPPTKRRTTLFAPAPNPFNPRTSVRFFLPEATHAVVEIHDARGRLVLTLVDERLDAGEHEFVWRGNTESGRPVASGVYFVVMNADGRTQTKKMTLIK